MTLPLSLELVSADSGVLVSEKDGTTVIGIATFGANGRRLEIKLKKANR